MKVAHVFVSALNQIIRGVERPLDVVDQNAVVIELIVIAVHDNDRNRKMAKAAGVLISYDPNYRPSLWKSKEYAVKKMKSVVELVDVMKVSDEESILLTGAKSYEQAAEEILAMGPKLVAITLGEQGVLMATKSRKEIIKAFQTHAVDTTGAGDSFWGGVLCSILSINKPVEKMEWEEIRKCAVLGNAVAGLCVQKRGGIPAIPTKEAVFEFMQK